MNVWETNKRSWRKARKRAVSPIIATILLVAITVVLAAVLYVLISGLTHGPGNAPIGSAFAAGNGIAANNVGSGARLRLRGGNDHGCSRDQDGRLDLHADGRILDRDLRERRT